VNVDHVLPEAGARWDFGEEVALVFDNMLARSVPQYATMREIVAQTADHFVRERLKLGQRPLVLDIGTSRGEALQPLVNKQGARCRYVGLEISKPMLKAARERFADYIDSGVVEIRDWDLRDGLPRDTVPPVVVQSVLTLQFTPIEWRQRLVQQIHDVLAVGGALILVEKVLGATARIDTLLCERYLDMKRSAGYSEDEIKRKRLALEGVLVPTTSKWNEDLLRQAGFTEIDCLWRAWNFCAWLAVRPSR
jgi:tRNA (cmo5U34)-methyltransferase